jgi:NAD(P)-dependent dehydrogenase (short-subunit alcohol dehydrogenase family)
MHSLGSSYRAIIIGSSGTIGAGFVTALKQDPNCALVVEVSRDVMPGFALEDEASLSAAATACATQGPFQLIVDATGALTIDGKGPEKHLGALDSTRLMRSFQVNAIGPALLLKYFLPLLAKERVIYAKLSARVGSISDNSKGGWYGYRASKAAVNMFLQTAAIEFARKNPQGILAALQPGTVASPLSQPFATPDHCTPVGESVEGLLKALDMLSPTSSAHFVDFKGESIGW